MNAGCYAWITLRLRVPYNVLIIYVLTLRVLRRIAAGGIWTAKSPAKKSGAGVSSTSVMGRLLSVSGGVGLFFCAGGVRTTPPGQIGAVYS